MTKVFTAHTTETDDVEAAVSQILSQLDLSRLSLYSAGIMYYHADFAKTGVTKRICEKLPFDIVGGTTSNSAVPGSKKDIVLTISVFTSDTVAFTSGISDPIYDEPFIPIEKLYREMLKEKPALMGEKPGLFFIVAPDFAGATGDDYLVALGGISGDIPVFGLVSFIHTAQFRDIKTFFNGVEYDSSMAVIAFWGNVEPKFFISDIPDKQIIYQRAIITDSYKNRIKKVNGIPVLEYLKSEGLVKEEDLEGIASFPLVLHMPGGSRLIRTAYGIDKNEILCSGLVPSHIPMEISFCDREFVMESARKTANECSTWLRDNSDSKSALVVSCAARRWTLGIDVYAEIREIDACLNNLPYHFAYSRGEFCPINVNGKAENYFFNYSLCICII